MQEQQAIQELGLQELQHKRYVAGVFLLAKAELLRKGSLGGQQADNDWSAAMAVALQKYVARRDMRRAWVKADGQGYGGDRGPLHFRNNFSAQFPLPAGHRHLATQRSSAVCCATETPGRISFAKGQRCCLK